MLGQPISMVLPEVIGYKLISSPTPLVTSTDIVLTVTKVVIMYLFYSHFKLLFSKDLWVVYIVLFLFTTAL